MFLKQPLLKSDISNKEIQCVLIDRENISIFLITLDVLFRFTGYQYLDLWN